jgi:diketogulonate reductase-like aldo/keto reductase
MKSITLASGDQIPAMGFGTWQLKGRDCVEGVAYALRAGYQHLDTADAYGNHRDVAEGIQKSGVAREDFFLTTKVWNTRHSRDQVLACGERFLKELEVGYIDLLLIHFPTRDVPVAETLLAMQELKDRGIVRNIGVSNFSPAHMDAALEAGVQIVNNQIEVRPQFNQTELRDYCKKKNISVTAYSSLRGGDTEVPLILELAQKYGKTPAQIILNWVVARGMIAIPKSSKPERIKENLESVDFEMSAEDLESIDSLPQTERTNDLRFGNTDY